MISNNIPVENELGVFELFKERNTTTLDIDNFNLSEPPLETNYKIDEEINSPNEITSNLPNLPYQNIKEIIKKAIICTFLFIRNISLTFGYDFEIDNLEKCSSYDLKTLLEMKLKDIYTDFLEIKVRGKIGNINIGINHLISKEKNSPNITYRFLDILFNMKTLDCLKIFFSKIPKIMIGIEEVNLINFRNIYQEYNIDEERFAKIKKEIENIYNNPDIRGQTPSTNYSQNNNKKNRKERKRRKEADNLRRHTIRAALKSVFKPIEKELKEIKKTYTTLNIVKPMIPNIIINNNYELEKFCNKKLIDILLESERQNWSEKSRIEYQENFLEFYNTLLRSNNEKFLKLKNLLNFRFSNILEFYLENKPFGENVLQFNTISIDFKGDCIERRMKKAKELINKTLKHRKKRIKIKIKQ